MKVIPKVKKELHKLGEIEAGQSTSRIIESDAIDSNVYKMYTISDFENDMYSVPSDKRGVWSGKQVVSKEKYRVLLEGDVIYNTVNQCCAVVTEATKGMVYGLQFFRLRPNEEIYNKYLAYLLNEKPDIRKQIRQCMTGSSILKLPMQEFKNIKVDQLPSMEIQKLIGDLYFETLAMYQKKISYAKKEKQAIIKALIQFDKEREGNK